MKKTKTAKILLLDIETSPVIAHVWSLWQQDVSLNQIVQDWSILSFSAKWLDSNEIIYFDQRDEKDISNDKKLLKKVWKLLDEADVVVGQNCVEVNTPVLTQDLRWVPVKDLKVGDKIVGFDEGRSPFEPCRDRNGVWSKGPNTGRQIRSSIVTEHSVQKARCVEVLLSNGDKVITTPDHYWLGRAEKDNNLRWYKSESLRPGQRIYKYCNVWSEDTSYEAGWLSGFISGEGTLKSSRSSSVSGIDFCQRPGSTLDQAIAFCKKLGIPLREPKSKKVCRGLGKGDVVYTGFNGGKWSMLEQLGKMRINRLIEKINWDKLGGLKGQELEDVTVVDVVDIGERDIVVLGTSTSTFIAAGYAMHNCKAFDIKKLNARFVINGMTPPSSYQQIDTKLLAKKHFAFTSNKLEYMTDKLCNTHKKTKSKKFNGHVLWVECMKGNKAAWKEMEAYNKMDVLSLEELYLKLRPWGGSGVNFSVFNEEGPEACECGSESFVKNGFYYTTAGKFQKYRCTECGLEHREKINMLKKDKRKNMRQTTKR